MERRGLNIETVLETWMELSVLVQKPCVMIHNSKRKSFDSLSTVNFLESPTIVASRLF